MSLIQSCIIPMPQILGPGMGCSLLTGKVFDSPFESNFVAPIIESSGATTELSLELVTNSRELYSKLRLAPDITILGGAFISTLEAKLANCVNTAANKTCLLISATVKYPAELLSTKILSGAALALLEEDGYKGFQRRYGPGFISGIIRGGVYYCLLENASQFNENRAALNADLGIATIGFNANTKFEGKLRSLTLGGDTKITMMRSGGTSVQVGMTVDEVIDSIKSFPESVHINPSVPFGIWEDYRNLPKFASVYYQYIDQFKQREQQLDGARKRLLDLRHDCGLVNQAIITHQYNTGQAALEDKYRKSLDYNLLQDSKTELTTLAESIERVLLKDFESEQIETPVNAYDFHISPQVSSLLVELKDNNINSIKSSSGESEYNEALTMNTNTYNIAIIGQTGVGKSSLINYLFDKDMAKTGIGLPQTEKGFHRYNFKINELPVLLFDSWGLEVERLGEWRQSLDDELVKRGVIQPPNEWFHTVIYCINATSSRIQDADVNIINKLLNDQYQILVVTTKADCLTDEELKELHSSIGARVGSDIPVIPICSQERMFRGYPIERFGKMEIEKYVTINFVDSIIVRLPKRCKFLVQELLESWEKVAMIKIDNAQDIKAEVEKLIIELNDIMTSNDGAISKLIMDEIKGTLKMYEIYTKTWASQSNTFVSSKVAPIVQTNNCLV